MHFIKGIVNSEHFLNTSGWIFTSKSEYKSLQVWSEYNSNISEVSVIWWIEIRLVFYDMKLTENKRYFFIIILSKINFDLLYIAACNPLPHICYRPVFAFQLFKHNKTQNCIPPYQGVQWFPYSISKSCPSRNLTQHWTRPSPQPTFLHNAQQFFQIFMHVYIYPPPNPIFARPALHYFLSWLTKPFIVINWTAQSFPVYMYLLLATHGSGVPSIQDILLPEGRAPYTGKWKYMGRAVRQTYIVALLGQRRPCPLNVPCRAPPSPLPEVRGYLG